tara:strand:+ start:65411 stop:67243 length:1833 start_codon:yes stop_codon:yes gene_type:complete
MFVMPRIAKPKTLLVVCFTLAAFAIGDVPTVHAQGILQRLGSRIRSRIGAPYVPPNPYAPNSRSATAPNPNDDLRASDGTRNPSSRYNPYPSGVTDPDGPDAAAVRNRLNADRGRVPGEPTPLQPDAAADSQPRSDNDLGGSILSPLTPPTGPTTGPTTDAGEPIARASANTPSTNSPSANPASANTIDRINAAGQSNARATIGIRVLDPRPGSPDVRVVSFNEGSRAEIAGLRRGDAILAVDGAPTPNIAAIASQLSDRRPGEVVNVHVGRSGRVMVVPVELVSASPRSVPRTTPPPSALSSSASQNSRLESNRPSELGQPQVEDTASSPQQPTLGIDVEEPQGSRGALVVSVDPGSPAEQFGLQPGDRIVAVDHRFVVDTKRLADSMKRRREPLGPMPIKLVRDEELVDLVVHFDGRAPAVASADTPAQDGSDGEGSILKGIGSKLGGWLGGNQSSSKAPVQVAPPAGQRDSGNLPSGNAGDNPNNFATSGSELPPAMPLAENSPNEFSSNAAEGESLPSGRVDELDFGDGEPIDQVIFEDATLGDLPPAMELREVPPKAVDESTKAASKPAVGSKPAAGSPDANILEDLRAEIERLQARLKQLEESK